MKALSFRRVSLVIGLAVGIMALWAAAAPSAIGADLLIGGWWEVIGFGDCCYDDYEDSCKNGPEPENCTFGDTFVCKYGSGGECRWAGVPDDCDDLYHTCPGSESLCSEP